MTRSAIPSILVCATFLFHTAAAADNHMIVPGKYVPATPSIYQPLFYAFKNVLPYQDTITVDRTYQFAGTAIEYKYDVFIDGAARFTSTGRPLRFSIPDTEVGKPAVISVSVRKEGQQNFEVVEQCSTTIAPPALFTILATSTLRAGDPLRIGLVQGVLAKLLPMGTTIRFQDNQQGAFFNDSVSARAMEVSVPMHAGAHVSHPTPIVVNISTNIPGQIDDEITLTIVPATTPAIVSRTLPFDSLEILHLDYPKMVIALLDDNERETLARGTQTMLRTLRTRSVQEADRGATIDIIAAGVVLGVRDAGSEIVQVSLSTSIPLTRTRIDMDKKTGEAVCRTTVVHTFEEEITLSGDALYAFLAAIIAEGPYVGKTIEEELRSAARLR